ncbi:DUF5959 family protein [Kitasatospora sp. NPDC048722]|uniref:DUF5959 family protein n=1 Tax=Kitasatospora sp. NPDC048722 TaxID=3155639 RepID=UPI003411A715
MAVVRHRRPHRRVRRPVAPPAPGAAGPPPGRRRPAVPHTRNTRNRRGPGQHGGGTGPPRRRPEQRRHHRLRPARHGELDAEVTVTSTFCNGRLPLRLSPGDLDDWADALEDLAEGRDACWMTDLRNPEINVEFGTRFAVPLITVEDVQGSGTAMAVPVDLPPTWVDDHRIRLGHVRTL